MEKVEEEIGEEERRKEEKEMIPGNLATRLGFDSDDEEFEEGGRLKDRKDVFKAKTIENMKKMLKMILQHK